jgi:hypothetical protein
MEDTNSILPVGLNNEQNQNIIQPPAPSSSSAPASPKRKLPAPLIIPPKGNDKRKESCKKVGGEKKRVGHNVEVEFLKQFNYPEFMRHQKAKEEGKSLTEYGATSDTTIDESHPVRNVLKDMLNITGVNVSNKSGKNLQFSLGNIPEFKQIENTTEINFEFVSNLLGKYLKKNNSVKPVDILVYKYNTMNKWIFFNIIDIIKYIGEKGKWRKLESGRYKCDFNDGTKKGYSQYITYEYRDSHKSYFLGANCGKGINLINLLMDKEYGIKYYSEDFQF